jgi:hypothetical protein
MEKANSLNSYYASAFSCERNIQQIQSAHSSEPFTMKINNIRKQLAAIGRNKSIWSECLRGEKLKLSAEAIILYLARLLDITINNATIHSVWKRAIVFPVYKGRDRSLDTNYRPIS